MSWINGPDPRGETPRIVAAKCPESPGTNAPSCRHCLIPSVFGSVACAHTEPPQTLHHDGGCLHHPAAGGGEPAPAHAAERRQCVGAPTSSLSGCHRTPRNSRGLFCWLFGAHSRCLITCLLCIFFGGRRDGRSQAAARTGPVAGPCGPAGGAIRRASPTPGVPRRWEVDSGTAPMVPPAWIAPSRAASEPGPRHADEDGVQGTSHCGDDVPCLCP